jgi:hypothetical protein
VDINPYHKRQRSAANMGDLNFKRTVFHLAAAELVARVVVATHVVANTLYFVLRRVEKDGLANAESCKLIAYL